jgi:hypothetical protein
MLQLENHAGRWCSVRCCTIISVRKLGRKIQHGLIYFLLLEDTTEKSATIPYAASGFEERNTRSLLKVFFWIVVSIFLSLALGQLK